MAGDLQRVEVGSVPPVVGVAGMGRPHAGLEGLEQVRARAVALPEVLGAHLDDLGLLLAQLRGQVGVGRAQDGLHRMAVHLLPLRHCREERLGRGQGVPSPRWRFMLHTTSSAVSGDPSWNSTPLRILKVNSVALPLGAHSSASSGCRDMPSSIWIQVVVGGPATGVIDSRGEDDPGPSDRPARAGWMQPAPTRPFWGWPQGPWRL